MSEAENVAGDWLGQSAHGFLKRGLEDPTGNMNAISLYGLSVLQQTKISGRSSVIAHSGAARESHKLQVRSKNIQGADGTLDHATIDLGFDVHFFFLFIS